MNDEPDIKHVTSLILPHISERSLDLLAKCKHLLCVFQVEVVVVGVRDRQAYVLESMC